MHIYYLYCQRNQNPIRHYFASTSGKRLKSISPVAYESWIRKNKHGNGVYIFSDIELLSGDLKQKVTDIHAQLSERGQDSVIWNHPQQSLSRYPLLRKLHEQGYNDFNVYYAADDLSSVSFPVFLRRTDDHRGPQSALITDRHGLRKELEQLAHNGENLKDWLVTEFCNVCDQTGTYRKYSAFVMGEHILPRHLFFGGEWVQKYSMKNLSTEHREEERAYLKDNLFADQLKEIFKLANIQYGRIDFGLMNGRVQTWEINTNPMICTKRQLIDDHRKDIHTHFIDHFHDIIDNLITTPPHQSPGMSYRYENLKFRLAAFGERHKDTRVGKFVQRVGWKLKKNRDRLQTRLLVQIY